MATRIQIPTHTRPIPATPAATLTPICTAISLNGSAAAVHMDKRLMSSPLDGLFFD